MATYIYPRHSYPRPEPFVFHITASCPEAKKQHAYAIIHEEIAYLKCVISQVEKEIALLKSNFNALSAIHKLPGEILGHIFLLLAHESQPPTTSWVGITRVCSHWRNTAMSHPEIWSRPDFRNPKGAIEMIKRAKACPLIIDFTMHDTIGPSATSPSSFNVLAENIPKARQFVFRDCECRSGGFPATAHLVSDVHALFRRPAPLLEGLSLHNSPYMRPATLPDDIFSGNAPKLRHISLQNWILPQTTSTLRSFARITSLKIVLTDVNPRYPAANTFRMLQHLPELQDLYLSNLLAHLHLEASFSTPFELPRLSQLAIFDTSYGCEVFFRLLTYPPTTTVEIGFTKTFRLTYTRDAVVATDDDVERTIRKVCSQLHTSIYALKLCESTRPHFSEIEAHTDTPWAPNKPKCRLSLHGVPPLPILLRSPSDLLPLVNLVSIVYKLPKSYEDLWQNIGQLPNLWSLAVHGNHQAFLTVMGTTRQTMSTEAVSGNIFDTYFPSLRVLLLNNWKFWDASDRINENFDMIGTDWFPPPDNHIHLALLTDALLFRRRNEQSFTRVVVMSSVFTPGHAAVAKEITGDRTNWFIMEHGLASAFPETIQTPLTSP